MIARQPLVALLQPHLETFGGEGAIDDAVARHMTLAFCGHARSSVRKLGGDHCAARSRLEGGVIDAVSNGHYSPLVIGKSVMGLSNAERQRRYIARLKAKAGGPARGGDARIRELEAELARERKRRAAAEAKLTQWKKDKDKAAK